MQEAVQKQRFDKVLQHFERARAEHHYYRMQCEEAEKTWTAHFNSHEPVDTMHYSLNKFNFHLTHNRLDQHILKQLTNVGFLVLLVKESPNKSII